MYHFTLALSLLMTCIVCQLFFFLATELCVMWPLTVLVGLCKDLMLPDISWGHLEIIFKEIKSIQCQHSVYLCVSV